MFWLILLPIALAALTLGTFYYWARRRGLLGAATAEAPGGRRVSLLTQALGYVGAMLIIAGGCIATG